MFSFLHRVENIRAVRQQEADCFNIYAGTRNQWLTVLHRVAQHIAAPLLTKTLAAPLANDNDDGNWVTREIRGTGASDELRAVVARFPDATEVLAETASDCLRLVLQEDSFNTTNPLTSYRYDHPEDWPRWYRISDDALPAVRELIGVSKGRDETSETVSRIEAFLRAEQTSGSELTKPAQALLNAMQSCPKRVPTECDPSGVRRLRTRLVSAIPEAMDWFDITKGGKLESHMVRFIENG